MMLLKIEGFDRGETAARLANQIIVGLLATRSA
jgi:hypothetical protein